MNKEEKLKDFITKDFNDWIKENASNDNKELIEAMIEMSVAYCRSEAAREYWKESLKDEMKQNAIEFAEFKEDYLKLTDGWYCLKNELLSPHPDRMWNLTELYDLFINRKTK